MGEKLRAELEFHQILQESIESLQEVREKLRAELEFHQILQESIESLQESVD